MASVLISKGMDNEGVAFPLAPPSGDCPSKQNLLAAVIFMAGRLPAHGTIAGEKASCYLWVLPFSTNPQHDLAAILSYYYP